MALAKAEKASLTQALSIVNQGTFLNEFIPNPGGQELFFRTTAHEIVLAGGNSSGKSLCGLVRGAYHTIAEKDEYGKKTGKTIHPYLDLRIPTAGVEGWVSSWSMDTQRDTLRPLIDKILGPYIIPNKSQIEEGVYKRMFFEGVQNDSWINMKWQTQGLSVYKGAKKNWVFMDEPHKEMIYKESRARLFRSGGYIWICMTPIVNPDSPLEAQDVLWMRDEIVEPFERSPEKFPLRTVIYVDVEENYQHVNGEFIDGMLAGMSTIERTIRKSGSFVLFTGRNAFDRDMILTLQRYLEEHKEESEPEYGTLEYDDREEQDDWQIRFTRDFREYFPDKPKGEYTIKIWEHPVKPEGLQLSPGYTIGCDAAEGKPGGDYSCAYVFRNDNRRVVASLHGHISEEKLARQLYLLGHYYNTGAPNYWPAMLAIEIRTYGATTQKMLISGNPALRIPRYPNHRFYYRPNTTDIEKGREFTHAPGWDTNSRTRKFVIMAMREAFLMAYNAIATGKHCSIPDIGCLKEAREFVQNKQGKYEGHPDDRLFALGIGNIVLDRQSGVVSEAVVEETAKSGLKDNDHWYTEEHDNGLMIVKFNTEGILNSIMNAESGEMIF